MQSTLQFTNKPQSLALKLIAISKFSMQLVVIAGGLGERLTRDGIALPKILLKCQGKTLLERIINEAEHEKFASILFCLGHKSEEIIHVLNGLNPKIEVKISIENYRLGTLGALGQSIQELESVFAVVLGDLLIFNTKWWQFAHILCRPEIR